ncbi:HNH endonuclease [Roseomonas gilardii]|uniref:HNH endonuclease n=1 Tax=Roseomonas gilardii TaxID=257708 RepID=UPI00095210EE|nr:HNH endonuclease [Roseomonas gilardii]
MEIVLSNQRGITIVDEADWEAVSTFTWRLNRDQCNSYAQANLPKASYRPGSTIFLHHLIIGKPPTGFVVDHINGNGLDNRRCNLRLVTVSQNAANSRKQIGTSSRFKGVYFVQRDQVWRGRIKVNGKLIALGDFRREIDAALAYNKSALAHFGEYAAINRIEPDERQGDPA